MYCGQRSPNLNILVESRVLMRRLSGEKANNECVFPTVERGGGSLIVSGCFGSENNEDLNQVKNQEKRTTSLDFAHN